MKSINKTKKQLTAENEELYARLNEAEETLRAIHSGEVDAFVVSGAEGTQIYTLKQAEDALAESEAKFQRLVEHLPTVVYIYSADGSALYISQHIESLLGYTPQDWLSDPASWLKALHPEDCPQFLKEAANAHQSGQPFEMEYRMLARDGRIVWVHDQSVLVKSQEVEHQLWQGFMFDITERKQMENTLRENEVRYRSLFEDSPVALWEEDFSVVKQRFDMLREQGVIDFEEYFNLHPQAVIEFAATINILDVNNATVNLFATNNKNDLLKNFANLLEGEPLSQFQNELVTIANGKTNFGREGIVKALDGSPRNIELLWRAVPSYEDTLSRVIVSMTNITERKETENTLRENEIRYRSLFEDSPVALWEEDFSVVKQRFDMLREQGVTDFQEYFNLHPQAVIEFAGLVKVLDVNNATLNLLATNNKNDLLKGLTDQIKDEPLNQFQNELVNIANSRTNFRYEGIISTLDGGLRNIELIWRAVAGHEDTLSRVIISMTNITERKQGEEKLIGAREFLQSVQDALSSHIAILDHEGNIVQVNSAWRNFGTQYGLNQPDYCVGMNYLDVCDSAKDPTADEARLVANAIREVSGGGKGEILVEYPCHDADNQLWFVARITSFENNGQKWTVVSHENITQRKQTEIILRENEVRYRSLFEDSPVALWEEDFSVVKQRFDILREQGITDFEEYFNLHPQVVIEFAALIKVLDVNNATMNLFATNNKNDLLKNLANLLKGKALSQFQNELVKIANGQNNFRREGIVKALDGTPRNIEIIWRAVPGYEDTLSRVIVSMTNITERKHTENILRENEVRYRSLFEDSPVALWEEDFSVVKQRLDILREQGVTDFVEYFNLYPQTVLEYVTLIKVLDINNATVDLFAANEKSAVIVNLTNLISGEAVSQFQNILVNLVEGRTSFDWEETVKTLDGDPRIVEFKWQAVPGHEDTLSRVIVSMTNLTGRKQAEIRIKRQLEHLTALSAIDRVIASNFDLELSLLEILKHVTVELGVDAADILILNSNSQTLEYGAENGFRTQAIRNRQVRLGESYAGRAALKRRLVKIPNLKDVSDNPLMMDHLAGEDFVCYYGVPLIAKGQVKGVLEIFHRAALDPDLEWLDFFKTLAGQAALAIDNATLFESLQRSNLELTLAYDATIEGWSRALDLRDKETEGHTQRVTAMTVKLARAFGLSDAELVQVRWGALLHDIGKMGVPDGILLKPGPLTEEEWVAMKKHPAFAYEMLSPIRYLRLALDIPYYHHERWDGAGYPHELKGERIPLVARIFAVVDVWDALKSDRPYRTGWADEKVREHIRGLSGTHFDPQVVDMFMQMSN